MRLLIEEILTLCCDEEVLKFLGYGIIYDKKLTCDTRIRKSRAQKKKEKKARKQTAIEKLQKDIRSWAPHQNHFATTDPCRTLFVSRLCYDTTEERLRKEFESFGPLREVILVRNKLSGESRGYAFIEFEQIEDMRTAYSNSKDKIIDGRRVVVDCERGRTEIGWLPMRLGGGINETRRPKSRKKNRFGPKKQSKIPKSKETPSIRQGKKLAKKNGIHRVISTCAKDSVESNKDSTDVPSIESKLDENLDVISVEFKEKMNLDTRSPRQKERNTNTSAVEPKEKRILDVHSIQPKEAEHLDTSSNAPKKAGELNALAAEFKSCSVKNHKNNVKPGKLNALAAEFQSCRVKNRKKNVKAGELNALAAEFRSYRVEDRRKYLKTRERFVDGADEVYNAVNNIAILRPSKKMADIDTVEYTSASDHCDVNATAYPCHNVTCSSNNVSQESEYRHSYNCVPAQYVAAQSNSSHRSIRTVRTNTHFGHFYDNQPPVYGYDVGVPPDGVIVQGSGIVSLTEQPYENQIEANIYSDHVSFDGHLSQYSGARPCICGQQFYANEVSTSVPDVHSVEYDEYPAPIYENGNFILSERGQNLPLINGYSGAFVGNQTLINHVNDFVSPIDDYCNLRCPFFRNNFYPAQFSRNEACDDCHLCPSSQY